MVEKEDGLFKEIIDEIEKTSENFEQKINFLSYQVFFCFCREYKTEKLRFFHIK